MPPAVDIRLTISARLIADRQIENAQIQLRSSEQQIEITERIEIAEERTVARDFLVILAEENLGAAKGVLNGLPEQPGK